MVHARLLLLALSVCCVSAVYELQGYRNNCLHPFALARDEWSWNADTWDLRFESMSFPVGYHRETYPDSACICLESFADPHSSEWPTDILLRSDPVVRIENSAIIPNEAYHTDLRVIEAKVEVPGKEFACFQLNECESTSSPRLQITKDRERQLYLIKFLVDDPSGPIGVCGYKGQGKPYFSVRYQPKVFTSAIRFDPPLQLVDESIRLRIGESFKITSLFFFIEDINGFGELTDTQDEKYYTMTCSTPQTGQIAVTHGETTHKFNIDCVAISSGTISFYNEDSDTWNNIESDDMSSTPSLVLMTQNLHKFRLETSPNQFSLTSDVTWKYPSPGMSPNGNSLATMAANGRNELAATIGGFTTTLEVIGISGPLEVNVAYSRDDTRTSKIPDMILQSENNKISIELSGGTGNYNCAINGAVQEGFQNPLIIQPKHYPVGAMEVSCSDDFSPAQNLSFLLGALSRVALKDIDDYDIELNIEDEFVLELALLVSVGGEEFVEINPKELGIPFTEVITISPPGILSYLSDSKYQVNTAASKDRSKVYIAFAPPFEGVSLDLFVTVKNRPKPLQSPIQLDYCHKIALFHTPEDFNFDDCNCKVQEPANSSVMLDGIYAIGIGSGPSRVSCDMNQEDQITTFEFDIQVIPPSTDKLQLKLEVAPTKVTKASSVQALMSTNFHGLDESFVMANCPPEIIWESTDGLHKSKDEGTKQKYQVQTVQEHEISVFVKWGGQTWQQSQVLSTSHNYKLFLLVATMSSISCAFFGICYILYSMRSQSL